jgi:DNA-binding CsgD family transcriptional regulator/PAS domain-containing protein
LCWSAKIVWDEEAFLDQLYGAALEPERWTGVMEVFADRIGGEKAWLSQLSHQDGSGGGITARIDPQMSALYAAYYATRNPLFHVEDRDIYLKTWRPMVLTDEDWMSKSKLLRSEYYNDFLRPQGIHSALMIRLAREGSQTAALNITRSARRDQFDGDDLETARRLHPHLIRAFDLTRRLGDLAIFQRNIAEALDPAPHGVLLIDAAGRVSFVNAAAAALMRETRCLTVSGGRLGSARADAARRLQALIASAVSVEPLAEKGGKMILADDRRRRTLTLTVAPAPRTQMASLDRGGGAIVWITDAVRDAAPSPEILRERFGLTPAESRLALILLRGESQREAADQLGVSFHTVRNQVRSLFAKVGARRQSDLVRRLLQDAGAP